MFMNYNENDEIHDALRFLGSKLKSDHIRKVTSFRKAETPDIVKEAVTACARVVEVLDGKSMVLTDIEKRARKKRRLQKKHKNGYVNRADARLYSGIPESTFDRKVIENDIKEMHNGEPRFKIDNLDKVFQLILDSSESVLCINTFYYFDRKREGYLPFKGGEYYKIIEEQEKFVFLYIEKFDTTLRIDKNAFNANFILKENLNF